MRILILGGTRFLGHHLLAAARARGHHVTLFHRGTAGVAPTPDAETIHGDRDRDLAKLQGRTWDAVIDTCGYVPRAVRASATALSASVAQYVYVSSVSAYADLSAPGVDETAPLVELTAEDVRTAEAIDSSGDVSASTYGPLYGGLKALCERAAEEVLPGRTLILRPGLIAGPRDYTDRLTYWPVRIARGGEVLAPGRPGRTVQFIDARDLAAWTMAMIERRLTGAFNVTGPPEAMTMAELLEACRTASGSDARFTWADDAFLVAARVTPWSELPLWLPEEPMSHGRGLMAISSRKAIAAGLRHRPVAETAGDVLRWYRDEERGRPLRTGLAADREQQLLQQWRQRHAIT